MDRATRFELVTEGARDQFGRLRNGQVRVTTFRAFERDDAVERTNVPIRIDLDHVATG